MLNNNIDYKEYLSVDNGKGILISKYAQYVLDKYKINYRNYNKLSDLIFDINNYINDTNEEIEDLEDILIELSETHYYQETKK